jgi:putative ABC transport system substrate-binding protein
MRKQVVWFSLCALRHAVCAMLLALCLPVWAQQAGNVPRIGVAGPSTRSVDVFRQRLRDLGYIDGKNVQILYRNVYVNTDRMPELVRELVQLKVDVLVVSNTTVIRAAQQATKTIPIIMRINEDPVAIGLVDSLARPGGNLTGITSLVRDLSGKRLELFKESVPSISRVGVFWIRPTSLGQGRSFRNYEPAARALKIELQSLQMHRPNPDLDGAFRAAIKARVNGLIAVTNAVLNPHSKKVVDFAIKNRLPLMVEGSNRVDQGGLISYGADEANNYRRIAEYVDKILKGAKPAELPVEQPTKFEFVVNLKTAKALNLTIPQSVLFRADRVIR